MNLFVFNNRVDGSPLANIEIKSFVQLIKFKDYTICGIHDD